MSSLQPKTNGASATSLSMLRELANTISVSVAVLDNHIKSQGLKDLDFSVEQPSVLHLPPDLSTHRNKVLDATEDLQVLVSGPAGHVYRQTQKNPHLIGLHAMYRFGIATSFPVGESATYGDIANSCGLEEALAKRLMRYLITNRIFCEDTDGKVRHTAASKAFAELPALRDWVGMICEELWPAAPATVPAIAKWPGSKHPGQTGFTYVNNTDKDLFAHMANDTVREQRFANAMTYMSGKEGYEHDRILTAFDWSKQEGQLFVDIGGSEGGVCKVLGQHTRDMRFAVQDMPDVIAAGAKSLPSDLRDRVKFMAHDFFESQPVKADIYSLRFILHDWPDEHCIRILRALIPALTDGAKVIISEHVLPEPGSVSRESEFIVRFFDLTMLGVFNSKERTIDDWKDLFKAADQRFEWVGVSKPEGSLLSFMELRWTEKEGKAN